MFGYDYVNLNAEQIETRRRLLDQAGFQAYLTPIIIILTAYAFRRFSTNSFKHTSSKKPTAFDLYTRRIHWLLTNTYIPEFGPFHIQLTGIVYATFLIYLITRNTGNDYMHVTKAFGHVAVSQLPMQYLLSFKSPQSPVTLATGLTHERLNAYHRLFGRIVHALLATHAILYLKFFVDLNMLSKRIKDWDVRYGLMAFWSLNIMAILAIPVIRKKMYHKVFYRSHVVLSAVVVVVVWQHVPYTRKYIGQAGLLWVLNGILRTSGRWSDLAKVKCKSVGGRLIETSALLENNKWGAWVPGMHGYLNQGGFGPKTPFTAVAVAQQEETNVKFIIRDLGGPTTGKLAKISVDGASLSMSLEGPYGEAKEYMPSLLNSDEDSGKILIVAGGVGATYALPIYVGLANKQRRGSTEKVKLIWLVKSIEDARWGADVLRELMMSVNVDIHVTTDVQSNSDSMKLDVEGCRAIYHTSRPEIKPLVDDFFAPSLYLDGAGAREKQESREANKDYEKVTVMVCGPSELSQSLRIAVGKHVTGHGREVSWFEEQFGFGGS